VTSAITASFPSSGYVRRTVYPLFADHFPQ
jgi:hypothetical protein